MNWTELSNSLNHLAEPIYLYMAGTILALVFLLLLLRRRQPKNVVAYTTENGRVMVSRSAIVELVQTSCEQLRDVSKPNVRIKVKRNCTHFQVRLKLASGGRLKTIEQTLQTHLRHALTENMGIENLGKIDIVATGFKSGRIERNHSTPIPALKIPDHTEDRIEDAGEDVPSDETENKAL